MHLRNNKISGRKKEESFEKARDLSIPSCAKINSKIQGTTGFTSQYLMFQTLYQPEFFTRTQIWTKVTMQNEVLSFWLCPIAEDICSKF